jgi:hypothetical protein
LPLQAKRRPGLPQPAGERPRSRLPAPALQRHAALPRALPPQAGLPSPECGLDAHGGLGGGARVQSLARVEGVLPEKSLGGAQLQTHATEEGVEGGLVAPRCLHRRGGMGRRRRPNRKPFGVRRRTSPPGVITAAANAAANTAAAAAASPWATAAVSASAAATAGTFVRGDEVKLCEVGFEVRQRRPQQRARDSAARLAAADAGGSRVAGRGDRARREPTVPAPNTHARKVKRGHARA